MRQMMADSLERRGLRAAGNRFRLDDAKNTGGMAGTGGHKWLPRSAGFQAGAWEPATG
jgi:hypothetical protein